MYVLDDDKDMLVMSMMLIIGASGGFSLVVASVVVNVDA